MMREVTKAIVADDDQVGIIVNKVNRETMMALSQPGGMDALRELFMESDIKYNAKCVKSIEYFEDITSMYCAHIIRDVFSNILEVLVRKEIQMMGSITVTSRLLQDLQADAEKQKAISRRLQEEYEVLMRQCNYNCCNNNKTATSSYCNFHQCVLCYEMRPDNSDYCYRHQCASCYDGKTYNSNYCDFHQCSRCYDVRKTRFTLLLQA